MSAPAGKVVRAQRQQLHTFLRWSLGGALMERCINQNIFSPFWARLDKHHHPTLWLSFIHLLTPPPLRSAPLPVPLLCKSVSVELARWLSSRSSACQQRFFSVTEQQRSTQLARLTRNLYSTVSPACMVLITAEAPEQPIIADTFSAILSTETPPCVLIPL